MGKSMKIIPKIFNDFKPVLNTLSNLECLVFDYEKEFNKELCKNQIWELIGVDFSVNHIKVTYVLDCGQHVSDLIRMDKFLLFVDKYRKEWEDKHRKLL